MAVDQSTHYCPQQVCQERMTLTSSLPPYNMVIVASDQELFDVKDVRLSSNHPKAFNLAIERSLLIEPSAQTGQYTVRLMLIRLINECIHLLELDTN